MPRKQTVGGMPLAPRRIRSSLAKAVTVRDGMKELVRYMRRMRIRWQLRNLEEQAANILEARTHALARLLQLQRERKRKEKELRRYSTFGRLDSGD